MESIVPTVAFPLGIVFTSQFTTEFELFITTALNCTLAPGKGCAELGVTVTVTGEDAGEVGGSGAGLEPTAPQEVQTALNSREAGRRPREKTRSRPSRGAG